MSTGFELSDDLHPQEEITIGGEQKNELMRELAAREAGGLIVKLNWYPSTDKVSVNVYPEDPKQELHFFVDPKDALKAYRDPIGYNDAANVQAGSIQGVLEEEPRGPWDAVLEDFHQLPITEKYGAEAYVQYLAPIRGVTPLDLFEGIQYVQEITRKETDQHKRNLTN